MTFENNMAMQQMTFENIMAKGQNADIEQFLILPQGFSALFDDYTSIHKRSSRDLPRCFEGHLLQMWCVMGRVKG